MSREVYQAFFLREFRATLGNRLVIGFGCLALVAGLFPLLWNRELAASQAPLFLLQVSLYLFPLLGILLGTGSAQNDHPESELLLTQPFSPILRALGKFSALQAVASALIILLFLPNFLFHGSVAQALGQLLGSLLVLGVFIALGLCIGFLLQDAVRAHLLSLILWLLLLWGVDLLAVLLAYQPWIESIAQLWTVLLMLNPLDALRVGAIFGMRAVPFDLNSVPPLTAWWLSNSFIWLAVISLAWISVALLMAARSSAKFRP